MRYRTLGDLRVSAVGLGAMPLSLKGRPDEHTPTCVVGSMIRNGLGGPDVCHTLYAAEPRPETPGESIILTGRESDYPPGYLTVDIESPGMLGYH